MFCRYCELNVCCCTGMRHVERNVHPLVGQREDGFADHEVFARNDVELRGGPSLDEDRIASAGQLAHLQTLSVPANLGVLARDAIIPGGGPAMQRATERDGPVHEQRAPPAMLRVGPLGNQIGHGRLPVCGVESPWLPLTCRVPRRWSLAARRGLVRATIG